jgi:hypothetical protein
VQTDLDLAHDGHTCLARCCERRRRRGNARAGDNERGTPNAIEIVRSRVGRYPFGA